MTTGLVKVMDSTTMALKRWETPTAIPLAEVIDGKLVLTPLGISRGYKVVGQYLEEANNVSIVRK